MIICNKCNHQNGDNETFCASCGAFLAWDGTRVAEPPPPPEPVAEAVPEADPSRPGLIQRVKAVVLDQGPADQAHPGPAPGAPPTAPPAWSGTSGAPAPAWSGTPEAPAPPTTWGAPAPPAPTSWGAAPTTPPAGPAPPSSGPPSPPTAPTPPSPAAPLAAAPAPLPPPTPAPPPSWDPRSTVGAPAPTSAPAPTPPPVPWGEPPGPPPPPVAAPWDTPPPVPAPEPTPPPPAVPGGFDGAAAAPPAAPSPPEAPAAPVPSATPVPGGADLAPTAPTFPSGSAFPPVTPTPAPGATAPVADVVPPPAPTPAPEVSFDVVPDAQAAARARQEAENARRYAAERARQEAEEAEREAFRKRQEAAAALFEQPVEPSPTPPPGQLVAPSDSGRWGTAPVPTPAPSMPASQLPGAAEAKRFAPRPAAQHAPPKPGDLVCSNCGAGNDQARKFCRQCGASLMAAVVEPKLPWWKRWLQRNKKKIPPPRPTGPGRPSKRTQRKRAVRRAMGYMRIALALVAVAGALGIAAIPALRTRVTDFTSCKSRQFQAIIKPPVKNVAVKEARATREIPQQPAIKAFDSNPATFWLAPTPPPPAPQPDGRPLTLTAVFHGPGTVRQIHFFPGLPKTQIPTAEPTPKTVKMTFRNEKGEAVGQEETFVLETNVAKEDQLLKVKARRNVVSVDVVIVDVFPAQGGGPQTAVSDVQFFGSPQAAPGQKCNVS